VTVHEVTAPHADRARPCSVADFVLHQTARSLHVTVPARSTRTLRTLGLARTAWPHVGMRDRPVNQDGCKGARLTLDYTGAGSPSE
jgi:hypothetical protein